MPLPERVLAPGDVHRFLREARAAARLDHPHIVRVFDAGELGPLGYFIASEFCQGPSLRRWLKSQNQPVPRAVAARWMAAIADAVQHAPRPRHPSSRYQAGQYHLDGSPKGGRASPIGQATITSSGGRQSRGLALREPQRSFPPADRLRPGQAGRGGRRRDAERRPDGYGPLHGSRAGRGPSPRRRPGDRRLRPGRDPLRDPGGPAAVPRRVRFGDLAPGPGIRAGRTRVRSAPGCRATWRRSA